MTKLLIESTSVPTATETGRWRAVLLTPGKGSSGFYSESLLKEYGPKALRKGAKSFVTHNRLENGEPDPFQMWGFLAEDARYEEGIGLVGEIEVLPSWREKVAEVAPHTALSIYVSGEIDRDGNVTELSEDAQNGVDLVVYPGRPGSSLVEQLHESMRKTSVEASADEKKENQVELKDIQEAIEKANQALLDALVEALKPAAPAEGEVDFAAVAEAVVAESDLIPEARARVFEAVKNGAKVEDALSAERKVAESYKAKFAESVEEPAKGRVVEGADKQESILGFAGIKVGA